MNAKFRFLVVFTYAQINDAKKFCKYLIVEGEGSLKDTRNTGTDIFYSRYHTDCFETIQISAYHLQNGW